MANPAPLFRTLAAAGVALAALPACDSGDVVTPDPCRPDSEVIVVGECFLGLTVDSDSADVVARLGLSDRYSRPADAPGLRYLSYDDHPDLGRGVVGLLRDALFSVTAAGDFTVATTEGITRGTPLAEVRRLLGPPTTGSEPSVGFDRYEFLERSVSFLFTYEVVDGVRRVDSISLLNAGPIPAAPDPAPRPHTSHRPQGP